MSELNEELHEVPQQEEQASETVENQEAETNTAEAAGADFEQKYRETYDQYVRLFAEFDNYKKRAVKERLDFAKTAGVEIVSAILPAMDDFNRAAKSFETATDIDALKEGIELIHKKIWKILADKGLEEITPANGDTFDADLHEAVTQIPAPDESLKGKIVDLMDKGFSMNGKIIRYPKVIVGA